VLDEEKRLEFQASLCKAAYGHAEQGTVFMDIRGVKDFSKVSFPIYPLLIVVAYPCL
jgi:hypothetical protein